MHRLEPKTQQALGGRISPEVAWLQIQQQVAVAIEEQCPQADELAQKMDFCSPITKHALWDALPDYREIWDGMGDELDLNDLLVILDWMGPITGLNELAWINDGMTLTNIMQMKPLNVLEAVLRIFTVSARWADGVPED